MTTNSFQQNTSRVAPRRGQRSLPAGVILAAALTLTPGAIAQDEQTGPPPPPELKSAENPPLLINYGVLFALIALAVGANAIPSKRGHQD